MNKEYSININNETRCIYFVGKMNTDSLHELCNELHKLETIIIKKDTKLENIIKDLEIEYNTTINYTTKPITLYLTSESRNVKNIFLAIDTIRHLKVDVNTVCKGHLQSCGVLLFLAGKKRSMSEYSYITLNETTSKIEGKFTKIEQSFVNKQLIMNCVKEYYIKNTKLTREELDKQLCKDELWNAQKCLETGIIDEILKHKKE